MELNAGKAYRMGMQKCTGKAKQRDLMKEVLLLLLLVCEIAEEAIALWIDVVHAVVVRYHSRCCPRKRVNIHCTYTPLFTLHFFTVPHYRCYSRHCWPLQLRRVWSNHHWSSGSVQQSIQMLNLLIGLGLGWIGTSIVLSHVIIYVHIGIKISQFANKYFIFNTYYKYNYYIICILL